MPRDRKWQHIGDRIRGARGARPRIDIVISMHPRVAESTLVNWEMGYTCPTIGQLEELARVLAVSLASLALGREEGEPEVVSKALPAAKPGRKPKV